MNVIVVDDEELILERMAALLIKVLPQARVACFLTPDAALSAPETRDVDVAILDISMPGMSGVELAYRLKLLHPQVNLIFATGYSEYAVEALNLRASGYLLKPVQEESLRWELDNLRNPVAAEADDRPVVQTFGDFEVFVGNRPVPFHRKKSKEILAYLVDRRGAAVTARDLNAVLWEDAPFDRKASNQISTYVLGMMKDLKDAGAGQIVERERYNLFFCVDQAACDYYEFLRGDPRAVNAFTGEYMRNYSWAEFTLGELLNRR